MAKKTSLLGNLNLKALDTINKQEENVSSDLILSHFNFEFEMEEKELNTLIEMGAITRKEAEVAEAYHRATPVRLACQCIIKNEILVKPFE